MACDCYHQIYIYIGYVGSILSKLMRPCCLNFIMVERTIVDCHIIYSDDCRHLLFLGLNSGGSCVYTWMAAPHRHVVGGELNLKATSIEACQAACINRTDCTGVDFNGARLCFMIVGGSSEETHADHNEKKHEEEQGCVHYDLKRACGVGWYIHTVLSFTLTFRTWLIRLFTVSYFQSVVESPNELGTMYM
jgi:hypothetical protein